MTEQAETKQAENNEEAVQKETAEVENEDQANESTESEASSEQEEGSPSAALDELELDPTEKTAENKAPKTSDTLPEGAEAFQMPEDTPPEGFRQDTLQTPAVGNLLSKDHKRSPDTIVELGAFEGTEEKTNPSLAVPQIPSESRYDAMDTRTDIDVTLDGHPAPETSADMALAGEGTDPGIPAVSLMDTKSDMRDTVEVEGALEKIKAIIEEQNAEADEEASEEKDADTEHPEEESEES